MTAPRQKLVRHGRGIRRQVLSPRGATADTHESLSRH